MLFWVCKNVLISKRTLTVHKQQDCPYTHGEKTVQVHLKMLNRTSRTCPYCCKPKKKEK